MARALLKIIRAQDLVWLLLLAALIVFGPEPPGTMTLLLAPLAVFQIAEPRIPAFQTNAGRIASNLLKLAVGYIAIGYTHGVESDFYFILLVPVVSAATSFGLLGTTAFIGLGCATYFSFLLFIDWQQQFIPDDQWRVLLLRVSLLPVVGFLAHDLAEASRKRALNYQKLAEQLAEANRSLHEAEAAARRADRLAALGHLTAGLAHEMRNPMSTIKNSAEMLEKAVPSGNAIARELAGYISSEVDRTNSLITRFLEFARPMRLRPENIDVMAMVDRAVQQMERSSPEAVIYKNYSPDVRPVPMDGELMERVVFNLIQNAVQASPPRAAVTVKIKPAENGVEISVIDRGSGIEPKHLENIFNPFFTTKADGVGLGLAIVSKIVDEHDGSIVVESHPGEGSVFRVYLPAKQKE